MRVSVLGFISVGAMAAAVHYVVALLAHAAGYTPGSANWLGFMCAFPVSYLGHRRWSFSGTRARHRQAFGRFFVVALLGFFANQALLWALLQLTWLPFWLSLALVMVLVALGTWLLSRFWAFSARERTE